MDDKSVSTILYAKINKGSAPEARFAVSNPGRTQNLIFASHVEYLEVIIFAIWC
jgi:hypothetical protein